MLRTNRPMGVGGDASKVSYETLDRDLMNNFNVSGIKVKKQVAQKLATLKKENKLDKDSLRTVLFNNTNNPFSLKGFNNETKFDIKCDKFVEFIQKYLDTTPPKNCYFKLTFFLSR